MLKPLKKGMTKTFDAISCYELQTTNKDGKMKTICKKWNRLLKNE